MKHVPRRLGIALSLVAFLCLLAAAPQAHSKLKRTAPAANAVLQAPPASVQVWFSEVPDLAVSKLEIKGPSDKVKLVDAHVVEKSLMAGVQGEMTDGVYTVQWQMAGDDGHVQKGKFSFTVKRAAH